MVAAVAMATSHGGTAADGDDERWLLLLLLLLLLPFVLFLALFVAFASGRRRRAPETPVLSPRAHLDRGVVLVVRAAGDDNDGGCR